MKNIKEYNLDELKQELISVGEKGYRAEQIFNWLYVEKVKSFDDMTNLSLELREKLKNNYTICNYNILKKLESSDGTKKYLFDILDGNIIDSAKVEKIDVEELDTILQDFIGKQLQVPPIYSSIKVNGKKLYEYARNNEKIEILPREIEVYHIKRISELIYENDCCFFDLYLEVSKGTYVRSLCADIGEKMNIPSSMAELCRIKLGNFDIKDAYMLKDIREGNYRLITMVEALSNLPFFSSEEVLKKARFGMKMPIKMVLKNSIDKPKRIAIREKNKLIAIYELTNDLNYYKAVRVWN